MGNVKLYAPVPRLADDATLLLWEPWRAEIEVNPHDAGKCEDYSIAVFLHPFGNSLLPPVPVHHANRSLSCLWVADAIVGKGLDAAGNSVLVELPTLEIGHDTIDKARKPFEYYGVTATNDWLRFPLRLVTAPMRVKVTVTTKCPDCRGSLVYGDRNCSVCANSGTTSIATTVSLPSLVVRHPLFPCEAEGVWSSMEKLQENKP